MAKIKFINTAEVFDVPAGTSILECAIENNVPLEHDCGGNCACTTCQIWVEDGAQNLQPMGEDERSLLEANDKLEPMARLGCQSRVKDGIVVVKFPE